MLYPAELRAVGRVGYRVRARAARSGQQKAGERRIILSIMEQPSQNTDQVELEVKLGFLERTVEELNAVVVAQADVIDDLRTRLDKLERQARSGEGNQEPLRPHDDPPPHY